jgi:hypothetical protein
VWCVNFTVWTTPLLTAHPGSPQKKRKIVLLFGQFYRFRFGLCTERWIGGGVLKWGIPKSPWASISSHDHPWFGWFGVTCCISSHPEVWIIWNVQTNSPILYSEDCLSNPSPSYSRMTVLISLVQNWVRQGLDGSYIFILKLLKTHLNLVPCACDSTGAGSTPCSSTAGSTVGSWRTGQIEPKFRLIILLVTVNVDLLCSFKNSFSRIEK